MTKRKKESDDPFEFEPDDDPLAADVTVMDKHGLARFLGMPLKDIDKALRDGLPTHGERVRGAALLFSVPDCVRWLLERAGGSIEAAKRRSLEAVARKREAEADKLESRYVEAELVESAIRDGIAKLQAELMSIPARVPLEVRELVEAELHAAINRLSLEVVPS